MRLFAWHISGGVPLKEDVSQAVKVSDPRVSFARPHSMFTSLEDMVTKTSNNVMELIHSIGQNIHYEIWRESGSDPEGLFQNKLNLTFRSTCADRDDN